jgi:UDP-N-acetyl-D-mannosaminuronic acid dehydrogenase
VDPWFIINAAPDVTPVMRAVRGVNDGKPHWVVEKVNELAKPGAIVACLGLAYKPDVDDLRESPSVTVVEELKKQGFDVRVVEPHLEQWSMPLHKLDDAVKAADVVVTLTGHTAFKGLARDKLVGKAIVDAVGIYR